MVDFHIRLQLRDVPLKELYNKDFVSPQDKIGLITYFYWPLDPCLA